MVRSRTILKLMVVVRNIEEVGTAPGNHDRGYMSDSSIPARSMNGYV